jgi:hypothetical protein
VLAHEFGHVLGLRDAYFRGYRDLGADGYQVMEVVADPDDIMGAPGTVRSCAGSSASSSSGHDDSHTPTGSPTLRAREPPLRLLSAAKRLERPADV